MRLYHYLATKNTPPSSLLSASLSAVREEVLQESYMMIPDSSKRFQTSLEKLLEFLEEFAQEEKVAACTEALEEAKALLHEHGLDYFDEEDEGSSSAASGAAAADDNFKEGGIF